MRAQLLLTGALTTTLALAASRPAQACGGCFVNQEQTSVVTDHRMILSVSSEQTTLYDQIRYSGNPESFAWVLPIADAKQAKLGLSADVVFRALDAITASYVQAPPQNCPAPPSGCPQYGAADGASAPTAGGGVEVEKHEVVGPYSVDYLHSTDPTALNTWLTDHGYSIPPSVAPIISAYVSEHFDFIAMKLEPGKGVQSMRPVRVTTPGAAPVLPLRMVAAGTGSLVGITLWVVGEGRYDTANFPSFYIAAKDLVWDWSSNSSNFTSLRQTKEEAAGHRIWEVESSLAISPDLVKNVVQNGGYYYGNGGFPGGGAVASDPSGDYPPIPADDAGAGDGGDAGGGETSDQQRAEDMTTLLEGMHAGDVRITRLRGDLAQSALATDLVLGAAADQSTLPNVRVATNEVNEPLCPIYDQCAQVGTAPRHEAQANAAANAGAESFSCTTAARTNRLPLAAALAGILGIAAVRTRRRRR